MAADAGDRTEAATPRRRQEAREHGQIPRSADLTSALLLFCGLLSMRWAGPYVWSTMFAFFERHLTLEDAASATRLDVTPLITAVGMAILAAAGPIMAGLFIAAVGSNLLQVGFLFTTDPLMPSLNRLNPLSGIGKIFSSRTLVQLAMNVLKLGVVVYFTMRAVADHVDDILLAMAVSGWEQVRLISSTLYDIGLRIAIILLVIALLDYVYQRWKHERDLRMTKEEVKEEMRRMEGDPVVKARRRKMQFVALMQQIRKAVPTADVVVTNPTELAIAIKYDVNEMQAPRVVAKGKDFIAAKIREIAVASGVPILERKPLAQALYKTVEVGHEVPEQFYKVIAEILAYVYELSGKAKRMKRAPAA
jgi:flagellar biosynthetic protein FlhB